jgi:hypothetical protein
MPPYPKSHILQVAQASFERVRTENRAYLIAAAILPPQAHTEDNTANSALIMTYLCLKSSKKHKTIIYYRAIAIYSILFCMKLSGTPLSFSDAIDPLSPGVIECANVSTAEWSCHADLLCRVFVRHYQSILNLGIRIPRPLFAFGFFIKPVFVLVSEFRDRTPACSCAKRFATNLWIRMSELVG